MTKNIFLFLFLISIIFSGNAFSKVQADLRGQSDSLKVKIVDIPITGEKSYRILSKEETATMRSSRIILKKGEESGFHSTDNYEEFIIILTGSGYAESESGEKSPVREGQALYIPPYTKHNISNPESEQLIYIYVVARAYEEK